MGLYPRRTIQFIFFEAWGPLLLGIFTFIFILLTFQALRLTEFVIVHGVTFEMIGRLVGYMSISFLPAILPMSLLFAILLTYGRLSSDSELMALKACGHSMWTLTFPALFLGVIVTVVSAQTSFTLAPWGNRQFEILITKFSKTKAGATLREGTFSEGFFNLVVYANKVDSRTGNLQKVFIFDERQSPPLTIVAQSGQIIQDTLQPGHLALLRLFDGDIHRKAENHIKIHFKTFDLKLTDPVKDEYREKSPQSLTLEEIQNLLRENNFKTSDDQRILQAEFHKRLAVTVLCLIFALVGVGLGSEAHRRQQKSSSFIMSLIVIILYWVLYITAEGLARTGKLPVAPLIWAPNALFFLYSIKVLRANWS